MKIKTLLYAWCCILLFSCESNLVENPSAAIADGSVCFGVKQTENKIPSSKSVQELKADSLTLKLEVSDFSGVAPKSSSLTRATRITKENLEDFGVLAYHTVNGGFDKAKSQPNFMYNTKVGKVENQWTYAPVKYFPMNDKDSVSFFAYAPYNAEHSCLSLSENSAEGVPSLTYTMPEEVTDQVDLLVADAAMNQTREQDKVAFSFSHALSCISFSIKGNGEKVKSIGLTGIATSGTLELDASEGITWSNLSQPSSKVYNAGIAYDKDASYVVSTAEGTSSADLMNVDGYLMVIPQQLTEDAKVIVTYENGLFQKISLNKFLDEVIVGKSYHFSVTTKYIFPPVRANANCFIVNPDEGIVTVPLDNVNTFWGKGGDGAIATHMGAETRSPNSEDLAFVVPENMITDTNYSVELVWSDVDIDLKVENKTASNFTVSGCNKAGNAVVCVKNPSGVILWSWHLWMTDFDPMEGAKRLLGGLIAMDRNLGATSADVGQLSGYGLLYQWGRKDPFLSTSSLTKLIQKNPVVGKIIYKDSSTDLISTVENPMIRYASSDDKFDGYLDKGHLSGAFNFNLWGGAISNNDPTEHKNVKTIYDPCPVGWRVPWQKNWNGGLYSSSANHGFWVDGLFFPFAGCLTQELVHCNVACLYWSAVPLNHDGSSYYWNGNQYTGSRKFAFSVRPVRDI